MVARKPVRVAAAKINTADEFAAMLQRNHRDTVDTFGLQEFQHLIAVMRGSRGPFA